MTENEQSLCKDLDKIFAEEYNKRIVIAPIFVAQKLDAKGYRKASEVATEIFDDIDEIAYRYLNNADYSAGDMIYDLNELKKKYTEVTNNDGE